MLCPDFFLYMSVWLSLREWYLNGNYLIIIVSTLIILPLALMRQLGMFFILSSHIFISLPCTSILYCHLFVFFCSLHIPVTVLKLKWSSLPLPMNRSASSYYRYYTGYLGYTSGFSLSCMVFFLISVSLNYWVRAKFRRCLAIVTLSAGPCLNSNILLDAGFSIWCFISTFNHVNQKSFYIWNENILRVQRNSVNW